VLHNGNQELESHIVLIWLSFSKVELVCVCVCVCVYIYISKAIPVTGYRAVRCGSHIISTVGAQMAIWLSALRTGHAMLFRNVFLVLLLISVGG
jgi:hypothetical protein